MDRNRPVAGGGNLYAAGLQEIVRAEGGREKERSVSDRDGSSDHVGSKDETAEKGALGNRVRPEYRVIFG